MSLSQVDSFEQALRRTARSLTYPRTPDVARAVRHAIALSEAEGPPHPSRGLAGLRAAALIIVIVAAVIMAVPDARALIAGWFRIGVINVVPSSPAELTPAASIPPAATPSTQEDLPLSLRDLAGRTTLKAAQQASNFRIRLPAYPPALGEPDFVFYQPALDLVVLVWLDANDPDVVLLSLFELLSSNPVANKVDPTILAETSVHGHPALWLEGPYPLEVRSGDITWTRIVDGRSLIWEDEGVTYRLESLLPLAESLKIAESIR